MPLVLIDTPGAANANTYCDIADGDTYHETRLYSDTWTDAGDDEKAPALTMATRMLDDWFEWAGVPSTQTQALQWPRSAVIGPLGTLEPNDEIPTRIREATAELARQLLDADRSADSENETQGVKRVKAGSVEVELTGTASAKPIPDSVTAMVSVYGKKRGASGGSVIMQRA